MSKPIPNAADTERVVVPPEVFERHLREREKQRQVTGTILDDDADEREAAS